MENEYTVTLNGSDLKIYSIQFKSECATSESATVNSGIFSSVTGVRKNTFTLKGRTPFTSFCEYTALINGLVGKRASFTVNTESYTRLIVKSGHCTAGGEGLCEYVIVLEENNDA